MGKDKKNKCWFCSIEYMDGPTIAEAFWISDNEAMMPPGYAKAFTQHIHEEAKYCPFCGKTLK